MACIDPARDELDREIRALAQKRDVRLLALVAGGEALQVFGQDELRSRHDRADPRHRSLLRKRLVNERAAERAVVAQVRIPDAVERGEAGRRQGLVDRRPAAHPRGRVRDGLGIVGEERGERRIEQVGVARPAAVVEQRDDRFDTGIGQRSQPRARPAEVDDQRIVGRRPLPQHRRPRRVDAERREQCDVAVAAVMPGQRELVDDAVRIDPCHRRLRRRPDFELAHRPAALHADGR